MTSSGNGPGDVRTDGVGSSSVRVERPTAGAAGSELDLLSAQVQDVQRLLLERLPAPTDDGDDAPPKPAGLYGSSTGVNVVGATVAELIGTFVLVLAGTATLCAAVLFSPDSSPLLVALTVALAFGLVLVALVASLGHVSGAHLNPAVTVGLAATGRFPWRLTPLYLGAQVGGAVLASLSVWGMFGDAAREQAALGAPAAAVSAPSAFFTEALITFLLVLVVVSVATDDRVPTALAAVAVGLALAAAVLTGALVSGGSVNPARALGPMIVANDYRNLLVFVVAGLLGGILGAVVYGRGLSRADAPA